MGTMCVGKIDGEKAFSTRFINSVYQDEAKAFVPLLKADDTPFTEPTGKYTKPVHAIGMRGVPINALKTVEFCDDAHIVFRVKVLKAQNPKAKPIVSKEDLETVLSYGGVHGYAGERSDGRGRYLFTVTEVTNEER